MLVGAWVFRLAEHWLGLTCVSHHSRNVCIVCFGFGVLPALSSSLSPLPLSIVGTTIFCWMQSSAIPVLWGQNKLSASVFSILHKLKYQCWEQLPSQVGSLLSENPMTDFMGQDFLSSSAAEKWIYILWRAPVVPFPATKVQPGEGNHQQCSMLQATVLSTALSMLSKWMETSEMVRAGDRKLQGHTVP